MGNWNGTTTGSKVEETHKWESPSTQNEKLWPRRRPNPRRSVRKAKDDPEEYGRGRGEARTRSMVLLGMCKMVYR